MPDRFAFNDLGDEVRCVWCSAGGPRWEWPVERRERHHQEEHVRLITEDDLAVGRASEADARRARRHRTHWWIASHEPRTCTSPYCSSPVEPKRTTRLYCSDRCRKATARLQVDR